MASTQIPAALAPEKMDALRIWGTLHALMGMDLSPFQSCILHQIMEKKL